MSRGSKVYYVSTTADISALPNLATDPAQWNDIAVVRNMNKTDIFAADQDKQGRIFQYQRQGDQTLAWVEIKEIPGNITSEERIIFTDDSIVGNVTKMRRAHIEEVRNFVNFITKFYAKRFGDSYYHTHDFTNAQLYWGSDSDLAKIEMVNNGADKKWLTLFFGDNRGGVGSFDSSDRFKIAFLNPDQTTSDIVDFLAFQARYYVDMQLQENLYVAKTVTVTGVTTLMSSLIVKGVATFEEAATFAKTITVNGLSTFNGKSNFIGDVATRIINVAGLATFTGGVEVASDLHSTGNIHSDGDIWADGDIGGGNVRATNGTFAGSVTVANDAEIGRNLTVGNVLHVLNNLNVDFSIAGGELITVGGYIRAGVNKVPIISALGDALTLNMGAFDKCSVLATHFLYNGAKVWSALDNGHTTDDTGINADMLDGFHAGNKTGMISINNLGLNTDLNADMLDGWHLREVLDKIPSPGHTAAGNGFNADMVDGRHAEELLAKQGHNNGFVADMVDGFHGEFLFNEAQEAKDMVRAHEQLMLSGGMAVHGVRMGHQGDSGGGINADMVDGLHKQDILGLIPKLWLSLQPYKDSGNDTVGPACVNIELNGATYYMPASSTPTNCHSQCHGACHGDCDWGS